MVRSRQRQCLRETLLTAFWPGFVSYRLVGPGGTYCRLVDRDQDRELDGQTSINELLDVPIGAAHIQLVLPFHVQLKPGVFRRVS